MYNIHIDTTGVSFEDHFEFPDLETLHLSSSSWPDSYSIAIRFFCENSPKLKDIEVGQLVITDDSDGVARSIGSLLSRPALRNLEIEFGDPFEEDETFHEPIMNLFHCPTEKPELERLKIDFNFNFKNLSLSCFHQFVKNNFNLKSLKLYGLKNSDNEKANQTVIKDIVNILDCDHGLETIYLGSLLGDFRGERIYTDIKRYEFPQIIEYLKKRMILLDLLETSAEARALI